MANVKVSKVVTKISSKTNQLYHLNILEEDPASRLVEVSYVSEWDEWREKDDIIDLMPISDNEGTRNNSSVMLLTLPRATIISGMWFVRRCMYGVTCFV